MKKAFITGITGQDGSYLSELLLAKDYEVHGLIRRSSSFNTGRIDSFFHELKLHHGDLTDGSNLSRLIRKIEPDEIYNLGAQSHVKVSFDLPEYTADTDALGTLRLLESIRESGKSPRVYQASSSEIYGNTLDSPQNEYSSMEPVSPYGCAKLFSYWTVHNYRQAYGIHVSNGILFNHESPRRGETFVTRKITKGLARIVAGKQETLLLGNLEAERDWGYAKDYVEAMWLMLQQETPGDYVIATGETHSVKEFLQEAFSLVNLHWENHVQVDPTYHRPNELHTLCGDPYLAKKTLGWTPKTSFKELVRIMVEADLKQEGLYLAD